MSKKQKRKKVVKLGFTFYSQIQKWILFLVKPKRSMHRIFTNWKFDMGYSYIFNENRGSKNCQVLVMQSR